MTFTKHHAVVDVQLDTLHPNALIPIGQNQWQGAPAPKSKPRKVSMAVTGY